MDNWFEITNPEEVLSPALLFYPERIQRNISQMIEVAGSPSRLRPHVKTYKCHEIVDMQLEAGINKFKCSTLMEAEMLAKTGVKDILVAYPLVGPAQSRYLELVRKYPESQFSVLVDHERQVSGWKEVFNHDSDADTNPDQVKVNIFIDLDAGMHRTGVDPEKAPNLLSQLDESFTLRGFHVYDGHIRERDFFNRDAAVKKAFDQIVILWDSYDNQDLELICGSSITFPVHAKYPERTLSPGTTLLWDRGYGSQFPDLKFEVAAILLTRVVSIPGDNLLCLDLGYKAVASEMKVPPVYFPQIPEMEITNHSEEHLVIKVADSSAWIIGDVLYGIPWHICTTVALFESAGIVKNHKMCEYWTIEARKRLF
ncbi:MAG: D-TA family PLP-dependent enzyme [Bacteroidota bacterium]